jgi:hypothetical protein
MTLTRTYTDNTTPDLAASPRARLGGPRLPHSSTRREELIERFTTGAIFGSHMPLDTDAHWEWTNPLNVIPALILLLIVIALVAAIV